MTAIGLLNDHIFIRTASDEQRSLPLKWFLRLSDASREDREKFELSAFGIHWLDLDEDLSSEGLLTYTKQND